MHITILASFFEISRPVVWMCGAGILLFVVALWAARTDIARAAGLNKIVALSKFVFRRPFGGLRRGASLGRKIRHGQRALVHAVAIVLGLFRRLCIAGRCL